MAVILKLQQRCIALISRTSSDAHPRDVGLAVALVLRGLPRNVDLAA